MKIVRLLPEVILGCRLRQHQNRMVACNVREFCPRIPTIMSTYSYLQWNFTAFRTLKGKDGSGCIHFTFPLHLMRLSTANSTLGLMFLRMCKGQVTKFDLSLK